MVQLQALSASVCNGRNRAPGRQSRAAKTDVAREERSIQPGQRRWKAGEKRKR